MNNDLMAFQSWHKVQHSYAPTADAGGQFCEPHHRERYDAFLAGAEYGRATQVADINELSEGWREANEALADAWRERDQARADLARVEGERDGLSDSLDMAAAALPPGFTLDREHNLHECIEALGKDRRELLRALAGSSTPRPDAALRDAVVSTAMEFYAISQHFSIIGGPGADRAKWMPDIRVQVEKFESACAALDRASSPAPSPVEAAAGRIRATLQGVGFDRALADLDTVLDALGAKWGK